MRVPVEECDAVNFPLPGPNCVGWEDRNIQGLNFLSHLHATKSLICSGLARVFDFGIAKRTVLLSFVFCFHINKGNKLMQKCYSLISRPVWILGIEFILIIAI